VAVANINDINREVHRRCADLGLSVACGPDGLFNAEVAVIGEAPGEREEHLKSPLIGSSGKLFWEAVRGIGLTRRNTYISNVVKRRLRTTADEKVVIDRAEIDQYVGVLQWELQQLPNLRYIIVLGNYALEAVTGLSGIQHYRGSVLDTQVQSISQGTVRDVRVICMLNPAAVIREPKWEIMFKFDVGRLKSVIDGQYREHIISPIINPSPAEAVAWLDKMQDEKLPVSLDIESIGGETACIGFANSVNTGMCINFRDRSSNRFTVRDESKVRIRLQQFISDETVQLVAQNGMFDASWLAYFDRLRIKKFWFDTMLSHHTLYPSLPHNLGFLTSQYTTHPFYKDEGKAWKEGSDIDSFWNYNVKDCCITLACQQAMLKELEQQGMADFFFSHVMRLQPHLINMTVGGIKLDLALKETIRKDVAEEVARLKQRFWELAREAAGEDEDYKPNPDSPKQMAELYFRKLRLVGRGTATDVKNRLRMKAHPRTPAIAREMLNVQDMYAKEKKFLGTYAEMEADEDERVRCEYKQTGVASAPGRLSSSSTLWGSGTNLQNQPGRAHKLFIADPGYGFDYFDLGQAEARVVGWKYAIHSWIEQFEQARIDGIYDAHRALASVMFDTPYDDVPKEDWNEDGTPTIRYLAKRCRHGLNYRMGADRLAETLSTDTFSCSLYRGEELWRAYHRVNPELQKGWQATADEVRKHRRLYNAYGRRWILLERFDDEALKSIVAFYPQSTVGDKVSRCIYLCEDDPEWPSTARMALNIHDALIAIRKHEDGPTVRRIMKKHAEEPLIIEGIDGKKRELIIPADLKTSVPDEFGVHRWSTITEKVKLAA
jgi:DNA polymerase